MQFRDDFVEDLSSVTCHSRRSSQVLKATSEAPVSVTPTRCVELQPPPPPSIPLPTPPLKREWQPDASVSLQAMRKPAEKPTHSQFSWSDAPFALSCGVNSQLENIDFQGCATSSLHAAHYPQPTPVLNTRINANDPHQGSRFYGLSWQPPLTFPAMQRHVVLTHHHHLQHGSPHSSYSSPNPYQQIAVGLQNTSYLASMQQSVMKQSPAWPALEASSLKK